MAAYRVHYRVVDGEDYRILHDGGAIDAKIVIVAAGTAATPVILQRSEPHLGAMPHAVGRYFSGNGERLNTAVFDEERIREVLGLRRHDGIPYEAYQIGRGPVVASWDRLDGSLPEYERYSLEHSTSRRRSARSWPRCRTPPGRAGSAWRRRRCCGTGSRGSPSSPCPRTTTRASSARPPETGNARRFSQQMLGHGPLSYKPTKNTQRGWALSDADVKDILERDGLARVMPWTNDLVGAYTVHPLSSCRIGDDPQTSALDDGHELRNHPGLFVTDGSAVPCGLTVNPALTISALAERAMPGIMRALRKRGVAVTYTGWLPDGGVLKTSKPTPVHIGV